MSKLIVRLVATIMVEGLLGIYAGILLTLPIAAISSGRASIIQVIAAVLANTMLFGLIIVFLYMLTLRGWIDKSQDWASITIFGTAAQVGIITVVVLVFGLRLDTLPEIYLTLFIIGLEWAIGVGVARWQQGLLHPPFQNVIAWRRWSVIGWSAACSLHVALALILRLSPDMNLVVGSAAAYVLYGVIAHCVLARFALDAWLAEQLRQS